MRIISLLPSATEILCELGLEDNIFGVTNECKYPSSINLKEKVLSTEVNFDELNSCLLYTSPSPRDRQKSRMPSSA